jgi:hypothetical protein
MVGSLKLPFAAVVTMTLLVGLCSQAWASGAGTLSVRRPESHSLIRKGQPPASRLSR